MKSTKLLVAISALFIFISVHAQSIFSRANAQSDYKKFSLSVGTGAGFVGLSRVDDGAYTGANGFNIYGMPYDFKLSSMPLMFAASARWNKIEPFIELEMVNFQSNTTKFNMNVKADINFVNFNFGCKYRPIAPIFGIDPYVQALLYLPIYNYADVINTNTNDPNGVVLENTNVGFKPLLGFYVGGDYMFTKNLGSYLQIGYGFEVVQLGAVVKL